MSDIDYLNDLNGKTVATASLEPEEGNPRRWVAVLTFTDGSRITFMADIDCGVHYVATIEGEPGNVVLDQDLFQHTLGVLLRAHGTLEREMNGTSKDTYEVWEMTSAAYDKLAALQPEGDVGPEDLYALCTEADRIDSQAYTDLVESDLSGDAFLAGVRRIIESNEDRK